MKKLIFIFLISITFITMGFSTHKFYVSIYQINFNQNKKRVEITSRIFVDDLNDIFKKKFSKKTFLGEKLETDDDVILLKKYISDNLIITINGKPSKITFVSKELENNILICYFNINEISKIKTIEIQNTTLFDLNSDQQNIIQTTINDKKQTVLLTSNNPKEMLKP
jgi:hypothetical protein